MASLAEIDTLRADGNWAAALGAAESLRSSDDQLTAATAECTIGECCLHTGELRRAQRHFHSALSKSPGHEGALYFLASLCVTYWKDKQKAWTAALGFLSKLDWAGRKNYWQREALSSEPHRWRLLIRGVHLRGCLLEKLGKLPEALYAYNEVWEILHDQYAPEDMHNILSHALISLGRLCLLQRQPHRCAAHLRRKLLQTTRVWRLCLCRNLASMLLRSVCPADYGCPSGYQFASAWHEAWALLREHGTIPAPVSAVLRPSDEKTPNSSSEATGPDLLRLCGLLAIPPLSDDHQRTLMLTRMAPAKQQKALEAIRDRDLRCKMMCLRELTLSLVFAGRHRSLVEEYRDAVSVDLGSGSMWLKLALALSGVGLHQEAFLAITQSLHRSPDNILARLVAAKLCLNHLSKPRDAMEHARAALQSKADAKKSRTQLLACQVLYGVACSRLAYKVSSFSYRKHLQKRALDALVKANEAAPKNQSVLFHLALVYADTREITQALRFVKQSLRQDRSHAPSWTLLAMLLSSRKQFVDAIQACRTGIKECTRSHQGTEPSHAMLVLRFTLARLFAHIGDFDEAVAALSWLAEKVFSDCDRVAVRFISPAKRTKKTAPNKRPVFIRVTSSDEQHTDGRPRSDGRQVSGTKDDALSLLSAPLPTQSRGTSTPMRHIAHTSQTVDQVDDPNRLRCEVLIALAKLYHQHAKTQAPMHAQTLLSDSFDCVYQARELDSQSYLPDIHAQLARMWWAQGNVHNAVRHYESALALDSNHVPSLIGLGSIENQRPEGSAVLSYGYLTSALQIDATSHTAWFEMGRVLQKQGKPDLAADHMLTALEMERTAPVVPFSFLRRTV